MKLKYLQQVQCALHHYNAEYFIVAVHCTVICNLQHSYASHISIYISICIYVAVLLWIHHVSEIGPNEMGDFTAVIHHHMLHIFQLY